jgi:hypothetical protein
LDGKAIFSDQEASEVERRTFESHNADRRDNTPRGIVNGTQATADVEAGYNEFWKDRGTKVIATKRTSLIVDPSDGRMPPFTSEGQRELDAQTARLQRPAVGPEDRGADERCILGFNSGPPMVPGGYNQNVQLFQAPGYVVIFNEMVHGVGIISLDGRPHGDWVGDSRGHWEGQTLIVDTTNFIDRRISSGAIKRTSPSLHLIERFRRVDAHTLLYEFTVDDPTIWTQPWTAQIPMTQSEGKIYEYACHEGNYAMQGILGAARAVEKATSEATTKGGK